MNRIITLLLTTAMLSAPCFGDITVRGKIYSTQGHVNPTCRTVIFKANDTGELKHFRIGDVAGDDDIQTIALAALMAKADVEISYDPAQTSGCGTEPQINYISIY